MESIKYQIEEIATTAANYVWDQFLYPDLDKTYLKDDLKSAIARKIIEGDSMELCHSKRYTDLITKYISQLADVKLIKEFHIIVSKDKKMGSLSYPESTEKKNRFGL